MYIVKITNNTPLCKMVNFSRSVLKIYTGQKKFTRAAPVAPVTNIRYGGGGGGVLKTTNWDDVISLLLSPLNIKSNRWHLNRA